VNLFDELRNALPDTAEVSGEGHLFIGGCDTVELTRRYGTPLLVFCRQTLLNRAAEAKEAFPGATIYYASKAFLSQAICRLVEEAGLSLDVASGGELHVALASGFPAERMILHGNNKLDSELQIAIEAGIGRIAIDNLEEIDRVAAIAGAAGVEQAVVLRLTPGVRADTHVHIQTGHHESKFGLPIFGGVAGEAVEKTLAQPGLRLAGVHAHIGSNIFSPAPFAKTVEILFEFLGAINFRLGVQVEEVNLGGGFGVPFVAGDQRFRLKLLGELVYETAKSVADKNDVEVPKLCFEPGRWLISNSMVTLYSVGTVKKASKSLTFVSVDGGMSDNIRPALYQAKYGALLANKVGEDAGLHVTLAGIHCESGDVLTENVPLPASVRRDDIVAMPATGAYTYSMASNYNKVPRPAIVTVDGGQDRLMVRRETFEDLLDLEEPL
jgi:diaminopimelate decarboxylase